MHIRDEIDLTLIGMLSSALPLAVSDSLHIAIVSQLTFHSLGFIGVNVSK